MTCRAPAAASASWSLPAKGFLAPVELRVPPMAPAPNPGPNTAVTTTGLGSFGIVRLAAVAAPQLAALILMLPTETDFGSRLSFILSWGILNFVWVGLVR